MGWVHCGRIAAAPIRPRPTIFAKTYRRPHSAPLVADSGATRSYGSRLYNGRVVMRGSGRITFIAGGLLVAAAWIAGTAGLPEAYWPVVEVLPELLAVLLLVAAFRFRRSRLAMAAIIVAVTNILLREVLVTGETAVVHNGLALLSIAVPINLGILALLRDHPLQRPGPLLHIGAILVQPWFAAAFLRALERDPVSGSNDGWLVLLRSPHAALLAFLIAVVFTILAFVFRRGTFEVALLWVLVASALALLSHRSPHSMALLMAAGQLALLFSLVEDSYRLAYHDQLTGLPGRRALDETLARLEGDYVLAMVDVDHFKRFNDRFGHDVGDQALRMVADELALVGNGGRSFRYGGEEFSLVFSGCTPDQMWDTLDAIRERISERSFAIRSPKRPAKKPEQAVKPAGPTKSVKLTVSIGAAGPSNRATEPEEVLKAADGALYKAKRRGRNRVVIEGVRAKPRKKG